MDKSSTHGMNIALCICTAGLERGEQLHRAPYPRCILFT